jgi:hypothetical protein
MRTYRNQHNMLDYHFGKAADYECVCGNPARDWAFIGTVGEHSDIYEDYIPLCRSCHKIHDAPTHCPQGHEYTEANTWRPPGNPNKRHCRECNRIRHRKN